ncbi:MAG: radical SAM protein [Bdellovibrionaceae bacterium]|nr:radical SAM protein [Pseudobdellovibrionaceae bacterium]
MLKINEIFYSIQGESTYAGLPTVFVRTTGCPLRCTYCDTKYSYEEGDDYTSEQLFAEIKSHGTKYVCITGGEPLIQKNIYAFMKKLCDLDYIVSLETSGQIFCDKVDSRVKKVIDIKTPASGAKDSFDERNLKYQDVNTEFKFVICNEDDFYWSNDFVAKHLSNAHSPILYSPSFDNHDEKWLAEKILLKKIKVRLHLQQHKYIWSSTDRGV